MANKPGLWGGGGVGRQEEGEGSIPAKQQGQAHETRSGAMQRRAEGVGNNMDVRGT